MTSKRLYLPSSGSTGVSPAYSSEWERTTDGQRLPLVEVRTDTALTTITVAKGTVGMVDQDVLARQFVCSDPLPAGEISGFFNAVFMVREDSVAAAVALQCIVRVISGDGMTVRGTLLSYAYTGGTTNNNPTDEFDDAGLFTRIINGAALTPVTALAGDLIVVEVGFRVYNSSATNRTISFRFGDPIAGSDSALTKGLPTDNRSWVEFTNDPWLFPPEVPTSVSETHDDTSITLSWSAPASGSDPTAYDVQIDGGSSIDVGTSLTYSFTDLLPDSTHDVSVRARNAAGSSSWVTLSGITTSGGSSTLIWDAPNERYFHTGVDRGVLYLGDSAVPWNGIAGVTESGAGERSMLYRDGHIYHADVEPGDFEGTLNAYFWPDQFSECLGIPAIAPGFYADNQKPKPFGLSYRSLIGSGMAGDMFGYQIHLVYNAIAAIGSRSRQTKTNNPNILEFTFDLVAKPVRVRGFRPTAHYIIDTRGMSSETLASLEAILYGTEETDPHLPDPEDLYDLLNFGDSITFVDHGDGTWTATGSSANLIDHGDGTWEILNVNGVDTGDGTYVLSDTP